MAKRANTKERLVNAALDLFSAKGYDGTSVDEIAESIGIKDPNLYAYFRGKEALLQAVVAKADEDYRDGMGLGEDAGKNVRTGEELKEYALRLIAFTLHNDSSVKMRKLLTMEQYRSELFAESATMHLICNVRDTTGTKGHLHRDCLPHLP